MAKKVLTDKLSEPLDGVTAASFDIDAGDGNLTIDRLPEGGQELARGMLQYLEGQGPPARTRVSQQGRATLMLKGGIDLRPRFRLPWSACNGATEWLVHLHPAVSSDIKAHSNGGNVRLDLAGMDLRRLSADTGGGNMEVVLPARAADLEVTVKSGAGNVKVEIGRGTLGHSVVQAGSGAGTVEVRIPDGLAARIRASTGLGNVIVDPRFGRMDPGTYQSSDFDRADHKVEITLKSGAGNVIVNTGQGPGKGDLS